MKPTLLVFVFAVGCAGIDRGTGGGTGTAGPAETGACDCDTGSARDTDTGSPVETDEPTEATSEWWTCTRSNACPT